jgi:hypothetical protein
MGLIHAFPCQHGPRERLAASHAGHDGSLPIVGRSEERLDLGRGEQYAPVPPLRLLPGGGWSPGYSRAGVGWASSSQAGLRRQPSPRSLRSVNSLPGSYRVAAECGGKHGGDLHRCDSDAHVLPVSDAMDSPAELLWG